MMMPTTLAHDPAVPSRDRLLNTGEMRARFSRHFGGAIAVRRARVKYRPSESLRVVYHLGRGEAVVTARTFPPGHLIPNASSVDADFYIPELGAAFWTFPHDRRIRDIRHLLCPDADLRARVPGWDTTRVVAYAPEKCAVFACLDSARRPVAYAKVFADVSLLTQICALHRDIVSSIGTRRDLTIARILAEAPQRRAVFIAPAHGRRVADLTGDQLPETLRRLGRVLAHVHQSPVLETLAPFQRTTFQSLHDAALLVGFVRPGLKHQALLLADDLVNARPAGEERVLLHGDLHLKNAFADEDRITLIDFDQAAFGPAAADVGSLLAAIRSRGHDLAGPFLDGYAEVGPLPSKASLAWHEAAALLTERAVRAITRMRLEMLTRLDRLIEDARELALTARRAR